MMGRRREKRREEREVFGRGGSANRYRMREKLVSFGNDFSMKRTNRGRRAFKVNGGDYYASATRSSSRTRRGVSCAKSSSGWWPSATR